MRLCPGGDPADDVRGSDLRPPLDRRPRGRDLPQKDQICGGGPSGAAAGHVSALGPLPKHVLISHRTNPVSTPGTDASGSVLVSFMLSFYHVYVRWVCSVLWRNTILSLYVQNMPCAFIRRIDSNIQYMIYLISWV